MKKDIFIFGFINCAVYIIVFLAFKYLNLLHLTGLRMINFLILAFISIYQLNKLRQKYDELPFLQVFTTIFFTGTLSFMLFAVFMFINVTFDPYLSDMYLNVQSTNKLIPAFLTFFEGSGGSIIVALIMMEYANRKSDKKKENQNLN